MPIQLCDSGFRCLPVGGLSAQPVGEPLVAALGDGVESGGVESCGAEVIGAKPEATRAHAMEAESAFLMMIMVTKDGTAAFTAQPSA